jgi:hypothetical protein
MGKLVWLASYPKSGSTWLRAFLHNYIRDTDSPYDINSLMDLSIGESGASLYRPYDPRPASQYSVADVQRMRPLVHRDLTRLHPDLVFVKTHNASLLVHGVPLVTPDVTAGAIYIVRDPRDVAISFSQHAARSIDEMIAFMANPDAAGGATDHTVYELFGSWSIHVHFWTRNPSPRLLVIRYEDMLEQPGTTFGDVIRFLGQEPPSGRLARAIAHSSFAVLSQQERVRGFSERPEAAAAPFFRAGRAGQWREVLNEAQIARLAADHAIQMQRFGYLAAAE